MARVPPHERRASARSLAANDVIFVKAGAEAFAHDVKDFVDSGHFSLETHVGYYAEQIDKFLSARILKA